MELKASDLDESWLRSALECYWRSSEEGAAYVPCPKALRLRGTVFDEDAAWCIYLPSLRVGYLVDIALVQKRENYKSWRMVAFFVSAILWMALLSSLFGGFGDPSGMVIVLYLLIGVILFGVVPELVFIPWEFEVRRRHQVVAISPEVIDLFARTMHEVRSQTGKATAGARFAGGLAGAITGIFLGKLGEKAADILVEKIVEEGTEDYRSRSASRVIHAVSVKHVSNIDNAGKAGSK